MFGTARRATYLSRCVLVAVIFGAGWSTHAAAEPASAIAIPVQADGSAGTPQHEPLTYWFVELRTPPTARGGAPARVQRDKVDFRSAAASEGIQYQEILVFDRLWNGLSVRARASEAGKLKTLGPVQAIYPVAEIAIPERVDPGSSTELTTALAMTGADLAQSAGLTGAGVRVAIMDTGIDYTHPDLGGCFGPGCRVETGFDFVGDDFDFDRPTQPNDDPMDCNGHGTHVAGIAGASAADANGLTGVAPGVTFGAYKVFGCSGSTRADIMIAAMEQALADNMDVLNMSIGAAFQWPQYPTAVAASTLVDLGMVVVASIGNSGANGVYSAGAPGVGDKVIGVASFDNSHINALTFNVDPSGQQVPYLQLSDTQAAPTSGTSAEVVYVGRGCTATEGDTLLANPSGKVALLVRGACTFNEKYQGAIDAGAVGVVIHNNVTGLFAGGGVTDRGFFGVGISLADGQHIRSLLDAAEVVTLDWTDVRIDAPNPTGGLISSFSSYGLAPDLSLKPDIGGPGGLIRSTLPLALGEYGTLSGTSMSAPHVAGAVALLLEARPTLAAHEVRGILQNTAVPRNWWGNPGLGFLDNVHRQGAGMLDIPAAIAATARVTPSKLALGESEAGPALRELTIENQGDQAVTYTLSHAPALSTGGSTFSPGFFAGFATVAFSEPSVTVPAGGSTTLNVTVTANPALPDRSQYGGYIVATGDNGSVLRVPYAGFKGDYQSIVALTSAGFGLPWLASLSDGFFFNEPDGATFSMIGDDIAYVLFHLDHQVQRLTLEVVPLRQVGAARDLTVIDLHFVPRNSTATGFFVFEWDGSARVNDRRTSLPMGDYQLKLTALKALGDPDNPAHIESWTSPVITIGRARR
jgi:minor extracellular serine protease Vpr